MRPTLQGLLLAGLLALAPAARAADGELAAWLREGRSDRVERQLNALQQRFESGTADEVELRDAYRVFYALDEAQLATLRRWAAQSPASYPARLALGIHYRRASSDARGGQYIRDTPEDDLRRARRLAADAAAELDASMRLTAKPYLSLFHRMEIDGTFGSHGDLQRDERLAAKMLPGNYLARMRFVNFTTPRWGGSYAEVDAFIARARAEGAPASALARMEAVELADKGLTLQERGDVAGELDAYRAALEKGMLAGGDALTNELEHAHRVVCRQEPMHPYCH